MWGLCPHTQYEPILFKKKHLITLPDISQTFIWSIRISRIPKWYGDTTQKAYKVGKRKPRRQIIATSTSKIFHHWKCHAGTWKPVAFRASQDDTNRVHRTLWRFEWVPFLQIGSPEFHGLVDLLGGRLQYCSSQSIDSYTLPNYKSVCSLLRDNVKKARTGSVTFDAWSAALGAQIMGVTWHLGAKNWKLCSIRIASLNINGRPKNSEQLCVVLQENMSTNLVVGSDDVVVSTVTCDIEATRARAVDLSTCFGGSTRCVVHTLA